MIRSDEQIQAIRGRADSRIRCLKITEKDAGELFKHDIAIGYGKSL